MKRKLCLSLALLVLLAALLFASAAAEPDDPVYSGKCGEHVRWVVTENILLITVDDGAEPGQPMWDYSPSSPSPFTTEMGFTHVLIQAGVSHIGDYAFAGVTCFRVLAVVDTAASFGSKILLGCAEGVEIQGYPGSTAQAYARANRLSFFAMLSQGSCGEGVNWEHAGTTLVIGGTGAMTDYASAGESPFTPDMEIEEVVIHGGVTHIGSYAFAGLDSIGGVTILNRNMTFGWGAFDGCDHGLVIYGSDASSVYSYADTEGFDFANPRCGDELSFSIDKEGVVTVSGTGEMWDYNLNLLNASPFISEPTVKSVVLPEGLTRIGAYTFYDCQNLTSVVFPAGLDSIGAAAFMSCRKLETPHFPASLSSIEGNAFMHCWDLRFVSIPYNTVSVGSYAFFDCRLSNAVINNPATALGSHSFDAMLNGWPGSTAQSYAEANGYDFFAWPTSGSCGDKLSWEIDPSTRTATVSGTGAIRDYPHQLGIEEPSPFIECDALQTVVIGEGVTRIGDGFFYLCCNLNSVTLPTTLTSIGDYAFACCSSLGGMMLPDGLTTIGNYAFSGCARLYGFLLPAGVRSIGDYAFQNCVGLGGLNFEGHDTSFGDCVFAGCSYGFVFSCFRDSDARAYADEHSYPVDLPDCGNDTKLDFDRAGKATILGTGAMYDGFSFPFTDKLRSVEIEEGVTSLSYRLFKDCVNLRSVSLPSTLSKIGASAFSSCTTLDSVTILHRRASIGTDAFASCPALTIIGWDGSTAQDYATANNIPFEALTALTPCGDSVGWRLNVRTGTVTISGTGEMWDYPRGGQNSPFANDSSVLRVVVEGGVTSVGAHFFENCANLAELSLAGSVESIGDNAFSHTALSSLILPEGLRSIGFAAFYECHSLLSLRLPESLLTIGANAFFYDNALSSVVLPRNVSGVGSSAFSRCQALSRAMLLNADTALGDNAFYNCAASLVLCGYTGSTAQEYAEEEGIAFFALDAGPSFFLPEGLTALGEDAFRDIAALAVVIPESITTISGNPFRGSRVTLIYGYPASAAETLAETCSFGFIPISDDWMENHRG